MINEKRHLEKVERKLTKYKSILKDESMSQEKRKQALDQYKFYYKVWLECPIVILPSKKRKKNNRSIAQLI